jgi:N-acyl homoserine lactone hydrolase
MGDLGWLISMYNPTVMNNTNPDRIWQKIPLICFQIYHPEVRWILYDTEPSLRAVEQSYWTQNETRKNISTNFPSLSMKVELLPARLAKLHLKLEDIGTMVVSHLHLDHASNVDLFPGAEKYVHRADLTNALLSVYQTRTRSHVDFDR